MAESDLERLFALPNQPLSDEVSGELQSILRLHSLSEQELFFKWEAYSMKLGTENTLLNYKTVRDFKKDLQDTLERDARGKAQVHSANKKVANATPRASTNGDVYGVLDDLVGGTPTARSSIKRRKEYETPGAKAHKIAAKSSPRGPTTGLDSSQVAFADRPNPGQIIESLNSHLPATDGEHDQPKESRVKLKANTHLARFDYKTMGMKLSEASEFLDDRIDEFAALVQEHHGFPDSAFGNPAARSTSDIIAVGRIASDSDGSINTASLVLESSRRMGAGLRVPLKIDSIPFDFFPGKIVAVKGINASGDAFKVSEVITVPLLTLPASTPSDLDVHNARIQGSAESDARPLSMIVASGPYTADSDLSYSALHALLERAAQAKTDVVVLTGPFLDIEHPLIASGDFELPSSYRVEPDSITLVDAFKAFITQPLAQLAADSPTTTVILVPSVRDAVIKHTSWPQDRLQRKELGLPKQAICVTNPITICINELVVGISSQDALYEMQRQLVSHGHKGVADDLLARLTAALVQQRHFFPVFPPLDPARLPRPTAYEVKGGGLADEAEARVATGACLDTAYLRLGEWLSVRPDLLVTPSVLTPFAKVVDSVVAVNPGSLSRRRAAGTFVEMHISPKVVTDEEREKGAVVAHELFNRARVDVVRI